MLTMLLAPAAWFFVFVILYASSYYEGGARGRRALAFPGSLYVCMAPLPCLALAISFVMQRGGRSILEPAAAPASPSPCAFDAWLRETEAPTALPLSAPPSILACATAFELLRLCEAGYRLWYFRPRGPSGSAALRRRALAALLSEVLLHSTGALSHVLALLADVRCAVLLLLPDLSLLGETLGFGREARAFRFSLRAAILVVVVTLTFEAACVREAAEPHTKTTPPTLVAFYLCSAWTWRALSASADGLEMLRVRRPVRGPSA